jgi:hypothetical protein
MSEKYCILCFDDDVSGLEARATLLEGEGYSLTAVTLANWRPEKQVSRQAGLCSVTLLVNTGRVLRNRSKMLSLRKFYLL